MSGLWRSSFSPKMLAACGVGMMILLVCWFVWWDRPPQLQSDREVYKTVDALFTAITAHDQKLLGQCEQRLHAYNDEGKMSPQAGKYLDAIVKQAREGRWDSAAEQLYVCMMTQRQPKR